MGVMGAPRLWTEAEEKTLRENWFLHGEDWDGWAEVLPGRTAKARKAHASKMCLARYHGRPWTLAEERVLLLAVARAAEECGRTPHAAAVHLISLANSCRAVRFNDNVRKAKRQRA